MNYPGPHDDGGASAGWTPGHGPDRGRGLRGLRRADFPRRRGAALSRCTHFLRVGTSGVVYPAAGFLALARTVGARCVLNALEALQNLAPEDVFRMGRAALVAPTLVEEWLAERGLSGA